MNKFLSDEDYAADVRMARRRHSDARDENEDDDSPQQFDSRALQMGDDHLQTLSDDDIRPADRHITKPSFSRYILTTLMMIVIGAGLALIWHNYDRQARAAVKVRASINEGGGRPTQSENNVELHELGALRIAVEQLSASQQQMARTVAVLQTSQQELLQALASRQVELKRLSDEIASFANKQVPALRPAASSSSQPQPRRTPNQKNPQVRGAGSPSGSSRSLNATAPLPLHP